MNMFEQVLPHSHLRSTVTPAVQLEQIIEDGL